MSDDRPRLLFVCSRNKRRSLTAEHLLRRSPHCAVRSVGTAPSARVQVREADILWADVVFAMEQTHVEQLRQRFRGAIADRTVTCLDIPDDYEYMDDALVEALEAGLSEYLP
ncbi:MAG: low molecular weight phosphotyrosine protein phosphatase [Thermoleophilia bacterium]|nr:low molecular weight phosphotyrosine protein phosphatase [Thermoleophilia bacterium]